MLLLPEEGAVDGEFGVRIEGEFIGQREHTRCKITRLRTEAHGMSGHEEAFMCTIEMSRSSKQAIDNISGR